MYKLVLAECYGGVIERVKSRNLSGLETGSGAYRSIGLMTTLMKGLISRLDDSSWNRELYDLLNIRELMLHNRRVVIAEEDFDQLSGSLLIAKKLLKVNAIE